MRLPPPAQVVTVAVRVLCHAGAEADAAHAFVIDMARAAQRQLPHDDGPGAVWLYQVEATARTRLARLSE